MAAARRAGATRPALAVGIGAIAVILFLVAVWIRGGHTILSYLPLEKPPAAMTDRERDIISKLGYTETVYSSPIDTAYGYAFFS